MPSNVTAMVSHMWEKPSRNREFRDSAEIVRFELHQRVREVAALAPEENRKSALRFAANVLGLPFARAKKYFYNEIPCPPAHEADQIRAYVQAAEKLFEARAKYDAIRTEYLATAHPSLLRFAPAPLPGIQVQEDRAEAALTPRDPGLPHRGKVS